MLILFILSSSVVSAETSLRAKDFFCVQTFNTFGPIYARDRSDRYTLLADYIEKNPCDVLVFQEVWTSHYYKHLSTALRSDGLDWRGVHYNNVTPEGTQMTPELVGLATFSLNPLHDVRSYLYPVNFDIDVSFLGALEWVREKADTRKTISVLRTQVADQTEIYVVNIHTHPTSQKARVAQIITLIDVVESLLKEDIPIVIAGDFNAEPVSIEMLLIRYVLNAKDALNWSEECTYCLQNPNYIGLTLKNRRLDYILAVSSSTKSLDVISAQIAPKTYKSEYLSDHYGVRAQFKIGPASEGVDNSQYWERRNWARAALTAAVKILQPEYDKPEYRDVYRRAFSLYTRVKQLVDDDEIAKRISRR